MKRIPVAEPVLEGNEKRYVTECLEGGWISGSGAFVEAFEESFAHYCGTSHAVAVINGTAALHLALLSLGVGPGDEVIVPDLTYIAAANAVSYCGARPVFVDVDPRWRTLDPSEVAAKISPSTKVVLAVHLYGHPADCEALNEVIQGRGIHLLEDAAEAHGAEIRGRRVGAFGSAATFSFFGNKIITTGEGGMVTTNDPDLAAQVRLLRGQGMSLERRYWFPVIGYNYRMTNLQAALGLAQLERIAWFVGRRREIASWYNDALQGTTLELPAEAPWAKNAHWLYSICLPASSDRERVMAELEEAGIETRPFFYPMHQMPPYRCDEGDARFPVATALAASGINLPSSARLSRDDIQYIAECVRRSLRGS